MSELAVLGCTVEITSGQTASAKVISTQPSSDMLVGQKGIYFGDIDVVLTSPTQGNYTTASATITIKGTASDVLDINDNKAVQKEDSGSKTVTLTDPDSGESISPTITVKITDAGQTDVIAT